MDAILGFFSDLLLLTAGLAVAVFWALILIIVVDEVIDLLVGLIARKENTDESTRS